MAIEYSFILECKIEDCNSTDEKKHECNTGIHKPQKDLDMDEQSTYKNTGRELYISECKTVELNGQCNSVGKKELRRNSCVPEKPTNLK